MVPGRSQLSGASPSTILYHDIAAGKHCHNNKFTVSVGWCCSFSPVPDKGLLKFKAGTQHSSIIKDVHCVISAWAVPIAAHMGPHDQHEPYWYTNISQKPLAKPSLRHQAPHVHTSPTLSNTIIFSGGRTISLFVQYLY